MLYLDDTSFPFTLPPDSSRLSLPSFSVSYWVGSGGVTVVSSTPEVLSLTLGSLSPSDEVFVCVTANNSFGESPCSPVVKQVIPMPPGQPVRVGGFACVGVGLLGGALAYQAVLGVQ